MRHAKLVKNYRYPGLGVAAQINQGLELVRLNKRSYYIYGGGLLIRRGPERWMFSPGATFAGSKIERHGSFQDLLTFVAHESKKCKGFPCPYCKSALKKKDPKSPQVRQTRKELGLDIEYQGAKDA